MSWSIHPQFVQEHQADPGCAGCWQGFPRACRCGGQIHAEQGDEGEAGDFWLRRWCVECGIDWDEPIRAKT